MSLHRGSDGADPLRPQRVGRLAEDERRTVSQRLATGTLACPRCDAPLALPGPRSPADGLVCPYCLHAAAAREFLSLAQPTRPARVVVRVVR